MTCGYCPSSFWHPGPPGPWHLNLYYFQPLLNTCRKQSPFSLPFSKQSKPSSLALSVIIHSKSFHPVSILVGLCWIYSSLSTSLLYWESKAVDNTWYLVSPMLSNHFPQQASYSFADLYSPACSLLSPHWHTADSHSPGPQVTFWRAVSLSYPSLYCSRSSSQVQDFLSGLFQFVCSLLQQSVAISSLDTGTSSLKPERETIFLGFWVETLKYSN